MGSFDQLRTLQPLVHAAVAAEADKIIGFVKEIVGIPSVTGDEERCALVIAGHLRKIGLEAAVVEDDPGRPNVIGTLSSGKPGPRFLFNGHIDVVPPGPRDEWVYDPFCAEIHDGRLHGRGTVDMKTGLCTGIYATDLLGRLDLPWRGTVTVTAVADEEVGGEKGIRYLLDQGLVEADMGINCEATNLDRVDIAHKGILRSSVTITGRAIHGSRPWLGINAVDKAVDVLSALRPLQRELDGRRHHLCGRPSLLVGTINGGTVVNMVPSRCEIGLDRRIVPGETHEGALAEIRQVLEGVRQADSEFKYTLKETMRMPLLEVPADSPPVEALIAACTVVNGQPPFIGGKDAGTDAAWIVAHTGMPMPVYGPGDYLAGSLAANESIALKDILRATEIYVLALLYLLGE